MRYDGLADNGKKDRFSFLVIVAVSIIAFCEITWLEFASGAVLLSNWFYIKYALGCSLVMVPLVIWRFRLRKLIVFAGFMVLLYMSYSGICDSRKAFLRDFNKIRPGMTVTQVEARMKAYHDYSYRPHSLGHGSSERVYRHTDDADWGIVTFKNGKVVESHFSPD